MRSFTACLVLLVACGGGGGSVEDKCEDLLANVCGRAVECDTGFVKVADCMAKIAETSDCSTAENIGETYETCMQDIDDASCQVLFPTSGGTRRLEMPDSCATAIE